MRLNEHLEHPEGLTFSSTPARWGWRGSSRNGWDRAIGPGRTGWRRSRRRLAVKREAEEEWRLKRSMTINAIAKLQSSRQSEGHLLQYVDCHPDRKTVMLKLKQRFRRDNEVIWHRKMGVTEIRGRLRSAKRLGAMRLIHARSLNYK